MSDYHLQQLAAASASAGSPGPDQAQIAPSDSKHSQPNGGVNALPNAVATAATSVPPDNSTPAAMSVETSAPANDENTETPAVAQPAPQPVLHQPTHPESQQMPQAISQDQVAQPMPSQQGVDPSSQTQPHQSPEGQVDAPPPVPPHATVTATAPADGQVTHALHGVHVPGAPSGASDSVAGVQPAHAGNAVHGGQQAHPANAVPTTQSGYPSVSATATRDGQPSQGSAPPQVATTQIPIAPQVHVAPSHQPPARVALPHTQHPGATTTTRVTTSYAQPPHHAQPPHNVQPHHAQPPPHAQAPHQPPPQTQPIQHAPPHHNRLHPVPPPHHHVQNHHVPYHTQGQHSIQATPNPAAIVTLPPVGEPLSLEAKYHQKCNECNALRHELELKNNEIRKLKQEFYKKPNSSLNAKNNNSNINMKTPPPALAVDGEKIMIDVDIGPSSSRTRSYDQRWKARFQDLVKYKLQHGDCIVPKSYKDKGLHSWVRKQRILKKDFDLGLASDESMTQERVNALNSIGFAWVVGHQSNDAQWEQNFQDLVVFKSQFGHTRVPQSYEKSLHKWVLNQRCRRRLLEEKGEGKAKGMTWARVEKLDAIDFSWSGKK